MENLKLSFSNLSELMQVLPTDEAARNFYEALRWNGTPVCPKCGSQSDRHYKLKTKGVFKGMYKCSEKLCHERFTVTVGTMFEGSHIGLRKWFMAMYIFSNHKKGISSHQLARDLGITQTSAWFMLSLLRNTFKPKERPMLEGVIMCDESYFGGKEGNKHKDKKTEGTQGRSTKTKKPVFGLLSDGTVNTEVVKDTKASTLKPIIKDMVTKGSILITDEHNGYSGCNSNYNHVIVNHKRSEYVKDGFSTNALEGFWSLLKRGIYGIYHHTSPKHLQKYCDEFTYRYNTRKAKDAERFVLVLSTADSRMTYRELIATK